MSIASVTHLSRDHIHIVPARGYEVVVFTSAHGDTEAVVAALDGSEGARMRIEAPAPGRKVRIKASADGSLDVLYLDIEDEHA